MRRPSLARLPHWTVLSSAAAAAKRLVTSPWGAGLAACSLLSNLNFALGAYLLAGALGVPATLWDMLAVMPAVTLAATLPVSLGGWGVREGALVLLLGHCGVPASQALALSLTFGAFGLMGSSPGPEYILFLSQQVLGSEPLSRLRIVPLTLCGAATLYFGLNVRRRFGEAAGWLAMLVSLAAVPFYSANASVHCLGYAHALLLAEMGLCLSNSRLRAPALLLGFLQGWMSFDFFFEVALVPLTVECVLPWIAPSSRRRYQLALWRCVLAAAGFAAAHLVHLAQVAVFYGSVSGAITDLSGAAAYRNGIGTMQDWADYLRTVTALFAWHLLSPDPVRLPLLPDLGSLFASGMDEQVALVNVYRVFGLTLAPLWPATAMVFFLADHQRKRAGLPPTFLFRRWTFVGLAGLVVPSLWWVLMPSHSSAHLHLHYRHLNVCFALWAIFLAVQVAAPVERWIASQLRPLEVPLPAGD